MTNILVIGDSHTRALSLALPDVAGAQTRLQVHWLLTEKDGARRGDLSLDEALLKAGQMGPHDVLVLSILGTLHNIYGLLRHEHPFWVAGATPEEKVPEGFELIPRGAMRALFRAQMNKNKRVHQILAAAKGRKFILMTPPPKGDSAFIESKVSKYRDRLVADVGVTEREVRLRMWALEAEEIASFAGLHDAVVMMPPEGCVDAEGFLRPEFYGPDATHANAAYGRAVIGELLALN